MPGNEVGDRVHNFFAQDNSSQGQHHSQVVDGSWPVGNNLWAGSQTLPSTNLKNYTLQQSDIERGHSSHSFSAPYGLNFMQPSPKPQSQQPNVNGYIHGHQILQTRQNGSSFLGVDTDSDRHNITSRGLSIYESQPGSGPENHTTSVRSESSDSPVSFDFFGSKQQMSSQQTGMLQSLAQQHSGFSDMQLLQQQVMMRKMQEFQRQRQIQQLEAMQQNSLNLIPSIAKQASGSHSPALINGTPISPISESANYPWPTEPTAGNTSWLQHATPAIQGPSNDFRFSHEQGLALNLMGLVPQQVDQSLYGVPISNIRGTPHQYSHVPPDKPPMQQMTMYGSDSLPGNQLTGFTDQVNIQDGSLVSRQGFHGEHLFGHASGQGLHGGMNLENLQQVNSLQRNEPLQEFHERQDLAVPAEALREKTVMQVSSSPDAVALDPTEEKILFGDDNIWDAFGSDANMGAGNMLNSTEFSNGLPSVQSGSWSALMQSAVAETTSNDIGPQEEWSGLSFQNTEVAQGNRQPSTYEENTKQRTVLIDNNFQIASTMSPGSVPPSNDSNIINSYKRVPGFQQSGQKISYEHGERLQMDSTHRSIQQSSEEGSKWLSRGPLQKPLADGSQNYGNASHSLDAEMNAKNMFGSWTNQQKVPPYNSGQPQNKFDDRKFDETVTPSGDAVSKVHGNEIKLQHLHSSDHKRMMYEEVNHGGHKWKADSGPNSATGFEYAKSPMGSPQVNREDPSLNNLSTIPNSSTGRTSQDTSRPLPNSHHPNYWKHAGSSMENKGYEDSRKFQHYLNKGPQVLESSMNSSDKNAVKRHEAENCERKENSSDSHSSNISQHTTTGGTGENVRSDGSDSRNLHGGKQKLSGTGKTGRRTSGPRKFQYHPLGNLDEDVEPSYKKEHATHSQVMPQHIPRGSYNRNQGYFEQSKNFSQSHKTSEMEKGHSEDLQGNKKEVDDLPSRGTLPGFAHDTSAPFDGSISIYEPNKAAQSSQNMLELLHKVDITQERGKFSGSIGPLQQNKYTAPQGFSLQLAPPSQSLPIQNRLLASQNSGSTVGSLSSLHTTSEMKGNDRTWLVSTAQEQSYPSSLETSQGEFNFSRIGMPGQTGNEVSESGNRVNLSSSLASDFSHSRKQSQNQLIDASGNASVALTGQSTPVSLPDAAGITPLYNSSGDASQPTYMNCSQEGISASKISAVQAMPSSQPSISSGISKEGPLQKMVPSAWSNVPGRQNLFDAQPHRFPPSIFQPTLSSNNGLPTSSTPQVREDQNEQKGGSGPSEWERQPAKESSCQLVSSGSTDLSEMMTASLGKEYIVKSISDASPSNPASTRRDIEAFGRSLKPNNLLHQNYSLLHQMQAMKSTEIDPSNVSLKRLKSADSGVGCQIAPEAGQSSEHNSTVEDLVVQGGAVPSGDSKIPSFLETADNWDRSASYGRVEHSQISPQMAPSWFNQFGNFKNGQILPMYDVQKNGTIKAVDQLFKSSDNLHAHNSLELVNAAAHSSNQVSNNWQGSTPASVAIAHFSSTQSLAQDVADQSLVVMRPKKRKSATLELLPWHKETTQSSQTLMTISLAEEIWAKAANRIIDKVHKEAEMFEDGRLVLRPRRRLILTTQLMQQLFRPPLAAVLSADASSNYETVAYLVTRLALGDACSLIPCSGSDYCMLLDHSTHLSDKRETSERIGDQHRSKVGEDFVGMSCCFSDKRKPSGRIVDQHISEVVEEFICRARKLENDFMRLDKRTSVADLRIENQDLEKVSVINRFAKFHGRGQADGAEISSSSDPATNAQRPFPQRYVTALPVPRNLPDRVQCLSL
ncbi:hypothetical protein U1Q18_005230 [Sarracenia purpurea var. burkii]